MPNFTCEGKVHLTCKSITTTIVLTKNGTLSNPRTKVNEARTTKKSHLSLREAYINKRIFLFHSSDSDFCP